MENNVYLKCIGCGAGYDLAGPHPIYYCKNFDKDDANHILEKFLSYDDAVKIDAQNIVNPYLKYKDFFFSYHLAKLLNVDFDQIVKDIDVGLKKIGEPGFVETPIEIIENSKFLDGKLIIKDETINVAGSHKARHLMGNILYLGVLVKAGVLKGKPRLAVYSCGNAALGAAAVARAAGYDLDVFIPPGVNPVVTDVLTKYDANIVVCPRVKGEAGDPCYNRFQEALNSSAVPFSCSGVDNWSNIEGGQTLCLELMSQLRNKKVALDSIVIQVGGGALASSAIKTLEELYAFDLIENIPRIYTVQTEGGFPLVRAYYLILRNIANAFKLPCSLDFEKKKSKTDAITENKKILLYLKAQQEKMSKISEFIKEYYYSNEVQKILKATIKNVSLYMWPWEEEPHSIAHGILDDITYDWFKIIQGMLKSGGIPVIVSENDLKKANEKALSFTGIKVDHTGSSGLAGLIKLLQLGYLDRRQNVAVLFTGAVR